ncbi:hypothetical protein CASFOL_009280 [Castilleja foliolosa]|uniref:S1-like domain-containing protein n=1 Tax=Castilleja foliolosa TaxID=1961234 RepID=A0ABD3E0Y4_9LAMI
MPKNKGKGGKNRKRGKNEADDEKRELVFKEDDQEYAQVLRMLGNGRCEAMCIDGTKRLLFVSQAYDRAALKFRGVEADINFILNDYEEDMKQTKNLSKEEFVHILRRHSTGFSRGSSKYRGVTLHKCGRWEARMGQFLGKKYIYLGRRKGTERIGAARTQL